MTVTFQPEDAAKYDCKVIEQGVDIEKMEGTSFLQTHT